MTAQVSDNITLEGEEYTVAGVRGPGWFDPAEHGLETEMIHTGCWRGFIATYSVTDGALALSDLIINYARGEDPTEAERATNAPPPAGVLVLVDQSTGREVRRVALTDRPCVIGRDPRADLVIDDPNLPLQYCEIRIDHEEAASLEPEELWGMDETTDEVRAISEEDEEEHTDPEKQPPAPPNPDPVVLHVAGQAARRIGWRYELCLPNHSVHVLRDPPPPAPPLFGVEACFDGGPATYHGLAHPLPFTGGVLAVRDFIPEMYMHMGHHPAWKYRVVRELVFERGELMDDFDRSAAVAKLRDTLGSDTDRPDDAALRRCFKIDYSG